MSSTQPHSHELSEAAPATASTADETGTGERLLRHTRSVLELVGSVFRVLREDSFQSRSAQRAQAVHERRRLVHKAGSPVAGGAEPHD